MSIILHTTSSARPAHAAGRIAFETDTGNLIISNGTSWRAFNYDEAISGTREFTSNNYSAYFDGTDDYIGKTRKQYQITEPWSVEVVFKPTDDNDTSWNGLFGGNLNVGGYWMFHSSGNLTYYEGYSGSAGTQISYRSWTKANTFNAGDFHHLVITYTPTSNTSGTFNLYYNGGEKTDSFSRTFTWSHSLDSNYIGMGGGNRYGTNDIHIYKEYNKVLSADKVNKKYLTYKNRFNI